MEDILPNVQKPARYLGNELNSIHKDWDKTPIRVALSYPDVYEIGMSNSGLQILYHIFNLQPDVLCERVFCPWPDMEQQLQTSNLKLPSLESQKPLDEFDLIGFSLGHELTYTNLITMLKLGNIPLFAKDRKDSDPLVFAGGPCTFNPTSVEPFFDFFVNGEAEEVLLEIIRAKNKEELAKIPGIYVPGINKTVSKRTIKDFDKVPYPTKPIVPYIETVHDRAFIEIMRGCPRNCKFCHARHTTRPVRLKKPETLVKQAEELIANTGYNELSLISLSSSDYPKIKELAAELTKKLSPKRVNIAVPSLRMDSLSMELTKEILRVRPSGMTVAPEAGTDRLRKEIGKDLTEEQILTGAELAFKNGISSLKLYFMIGLPTETEEDLLGICELAKKILAIGKRITNRARVTVNLSTFIPKPHTPLQRERQISIEESIVKQKLIKQNCKGRNLEVRWHQAEASFLEGVFSRGDQKLAPVIVKAWELGARFDAWSEHFKFDLWQKAFAECGIDPNAYLRERKADESLPWDFINAKNPN
ncbi:radical SAM protein [Candidatus Margulisiibacteriota bacterium]